MKAKQSVYSFPDLKCTKWNTVRELDGRTRFRLGHLQSRKNHLQAEHASLLAVNAIRHNNAHVHNVINWGRDRC